MTDQELHDEYIRDVTTIFAQYKDLGDKSFEQIEGPEIHWKVERESNSIATVVMHVSGNLRSRWTDFLTADGEKPWRNRDSEFVDTTLSKEQLLAAWEAGWKCLFDALKAVDASTLGRTITIRGEAYTVQRALQRSITHTAYHVGQIVFIAKVLRSAEWKSLSIPKNRSAAFNASMGMKPGGSKPGGST
jgi:uncharacterized damage-inducible protein DinB